MADPHRQNTISAGDWQGEQLSSKASTNNDFSTVREQGLSTGVRVKEDGRLDINFREHKPWLATLMNHVEKPTRPVAEQQEELNIVPKEEAKFSLNLNIVLQVVGSRGDVQPFVALGKELQKHGHRVRLATHMSFRKDVNGAGLEFFNIGGNPEELMAFMVKNPGLLPGIRTIRSGEIQKRRREMKAIFSGCWRSCYETGDGTGMHQISEHTQGGAVDRYTRPFVADVIIANPPGFVHFSCAEKLGIPLNMMFTMPWSPTQSFPHPLANIRSQKTKPSVANFASYGIVEVMMWEGLGDLINHFRKKELGLDPLDAIRAPSMIHRLQIPYTYLWSPSLLPKPRDWSNNIDVCGFQFLSTESEYEPPEELDAFLKAGQPPIYIGFGSIVVDNPKKLTRTIFEAVRQTGHRALISKGWGNIGSGETDIPDSIFLLGPCPHDWLFRQVSCVVHHGGAGTTAAGLLLGRPTVIVPFFGDQPFWGSIVARAGAGPRPIPYKELTAEKLASAIQVALGEQARENAKQIGENMRTEQGVQKAVHSFHQHLNIEKLRCTICPDRPAVWWLRNSHTKLSAFAVSILLHTGHIKPQDITLYRVREYDTNRDPRGPLSASAEVLYGLMTDLITGIARVPGQLVSIFPGSHPRTVQQDFRGREWAMSHFAECLSNQERRRDSQTVTDISTPSGELYSPGPDEYVREHPGIIQSSNAVTNETVANLSESHSVDGAQFTRRQTAKKKGEEKSYFKRRRRARKVLSETRYYAAKSAKHALNFVLVLPTDFTLSLSKGFHNAPKLYHDDTVESMPKVIGIKSGFRAAGKEFYHGIYHGLTGLVTLPSRGFRQSGGKGMVKGIGKGVGGVFFKPTAGLFGLAGLPLDGLHKCVRGSLSKIKSKEIIRLRITQGIEEMCAASNEEQNMVIRKWHALQQDGLTQEGH
ncbi:UDP-glucosesterol transferase [Penicillium canescens]|uniref:UDP-glucosesterol transferase n=1 Tax=Penicillium canescens TaxID=5083 RepID=UPI0026DF5F19|nr:UDP-glucosesterol transferase [Penicillium canescens]KAJ6025255.1 UDP-glucosesterol transferase [Penicillium canescens]KAJ6042768.1 UDP-glucosesterol transferase [Penicillium canescens]